jgi:hypothetical protein
MNAEGGMRNVEFFYPQITQITADYFKEKINKKMGRS